MRTSEVVEKDSFWRGKIPCWVMRECPVEARALCPAHGHQSRPCWEGVCLCTELLGVDTCFVCEVFQKYNDEPTHTDDRSDALDGQE